MTVGLNFCLGKIRITLVVIFNVKQILKLNKNLYNDNTYFYKIKEDIDVDYEEDFRTCIEHGEAMTFRVETDKKCHGAFYQDHKWRI